MLSKYSAYQEISWCKTIIRNIAINMQKRHVRWNRDLLILNKPDSYDDELQNKIPCNNGEFKSVEFQLFLEEVLSEMELNIISGLYLEGWSQRVTAKKNSLSQSAVSRINRQALKKLREAMKE